MKGKATISEFVTRWSIPLLLIVLCVGCLSPIEITGEYIGGQVVVYGQISTIQEQNFIQLGLTANSERVPFPLSGASVVVLDDLGNYNYYFEDALRPGFYISNNATAIPGITYHVQIVTPDGRTYESIPETAPQSPGSVTTNFEIVSEEYTDGDGTVVTSPFVKVYADVTLPETPESLHLKWNVDEVFLLTPTDFPDPFAQVPPSCYIAQNADPQRLPLLDGDDIEQTSFNHMLVASRMVDYSFLERHYFTTYQSSLTNDAFEYWRKVNILANSVGSIFDTPPAEINGNVFNVNDPDEKVHGYFQAVNEVYHRFYMLPNDFPFTLLFDDCPYDPLATKYPNRCLDCLSVRNSSFNRPIWF